MNRVFGFIQQIIRQIGKSSENVTISPDETVTRYIFSKHHFKAKNNVIEPEAFYPHPPTSRELSVYRIKTMGEEIIWDSGDKFVRKQRPETLKARADLRVYEIERIESDKIKNQPRYLKVQADPRPHPLHANIKNIATQDGLKKLIALKLVQISALKLR